MIDFGEYSISDDALNHIAIGDFTQQLNPEDRKVSKMVITGGLHTYDGWKAYREKVQGLEHLHYYESTKDLYWYYARELQNGVITLKIPEELFQRRAANKTLFPDTYYKSGYLWKTLFPKTYGRKEVIEVIREALGNISKRESKGGSVIGYVNQGDKLKTMRVEILHRDKKINSAFPSWEQPNTGNNGKAYSHLDSIGFVFAESTEYFGDQKVWGRDIGVDLLEQDGGLISLIKKTPKLFLTRCIPNGNAFEWKRLRFKELLTLSETMKKTELDTICVYVKNHALNKMYGVIATQAYNELRGTDYWDRSTHNCFQFTRNIIDGLILTRLYDNRNGTNNFLGCVEYILNNMITSELGLDCWSKKMIHTEIASLVFKYESTENKVVYLKLLANSPIRKEFMWEFNVGTVIKQDLDLTTAKLDELAIILAPDLKIEFKLSHIYEYIKQSLGDTYALHYSRDELNKFVDDLFNNRGHKYSALIEDCISYCEPVDITPFGYQMAKLIESIPKEALDLTTIKKITKDYKRLH